jgi:hypothetical protein
VDLFFPHTRGNCMDFETTLDEGAVGADVGAVGAEVGAVGARKGAVRAKKGAVGAKSGAMGAESSAESARRDAGLAAKVLELLTESESEADRISASRKRAIAGRLWADDDTDSDEPRTVKSPVVPATKVLRSAAGRGGFRHSVGLSQARKELATEPDDSESSMMIGAEPDPRQSPKEKGDDGSPWWAIDLNIEEIEKRAEEGAARIEKVLKKSKNLKGTCVKEIRDASLAVMRAVRALAAKQDGEEIRRLNEDNRRLRGQMEALSGEVKALRRAFSVREVSPKMSKKATPVEAPEAPITIQSHEERPSASLTREELAEMMETMQRELMRHIGGVISARLEGLEVDGRLLPAQSRRPPLKADGTAPRPPLAVPGNPATVNSAPTTLTPPANMPKRARQKKAPKKANPKEGDKRAEAQIAGPPNENQPLVSEEGWNVVARKPKKTPAKAGTPAKKQTPKVPKPPKTLAVILTLKPEAVAKGATYNAALLEARQKVSLTELGIGPG